MKKLLVCLFFVFCASTGAQAQECDCMIDTAAVRDTFAFSAQGTWDTVRLCIMGLVGDDGTGGPAEANWYDTAAAITNGLYDTNGVYFDYAYAEVRDDWLAQTHGAGRWVFQIGPAIACRPDSQMVTISPSQIGGLEGDIAFGGYGYWQPYTDTLHEGFTIFDQDYYNQYTLPHELGHHLGLEHTFLGAFTGTGDCDGRPYANSGDAAYDDTTGDYCGDTPPSPYNGASESPLCGDTPHTLYDSCSVVNGVDSCWGAVQHNNVMDYIVDVDSLMMSADQGSRVRGFIALYYACRKGAMPE